MGLLTGKTALITGAARGIGKAVAMKFAKEGANIAFTDLVLNDDMAAGLEATRKEIEALGVTCRLRLYRRIGKQCRYYKGRTDAPHERGSVGRCAEREPEVCIQLHPRLLTNHAPSAWRFYHQHGFCSRCTRQRWTV